jgi:hypothetical protein
MKKSPARSAVCFPARTTPDDEIAARLELSLRESMEAKRRNQRESEAEEETLP